MAGWSAACGEHDALLASPTTTEVIGCRNIGIREGNRQVDHCDMDLQDLVATGKAQGYLTYDQVNDYLPDEAVTPEKLDNLLIALEELGTELVTDPPEPASVPPELFVVIAQVE